MNELQVGIDRGPTAVREPSPERPMAMNEVLALIWRHFWLVALIVTVSLVVANAVSKRTPPAWRASAQLLLVQRAPVLAMSSQQVSSAPMVESIDTQISLLQSRALAQAAASRVGINPDTFMAATTVSQEREDDNVIDVAVEADSRKHAVDWANALCESFVAYKNDVAQHNSLKTYSNLQSEAAEARRQMDAADADLLAFQKYHRLNGVGVVDAQAQKSAALGAYNMQDALVAQFRNEYAAAVAKASSLAAQLRQANLAIKNGTAVRDDGEVILLQEKLHSLQLERDQTAQRYTTKFPGKLSVLDASIADVKSRLERAIQGTLKNNPSLQAQGALANAYQTAQSEVASARLKLDAATARRDETKREMNTLPEIAMSAEKLTQRVDQAHKLYNSLSAAVQAAHLDVDVASGNVQIVQPAYAGDAPIRPHRKRDLVVGAVVGLLISAIAIFLLEQSDRSLRTSDEVRQLAEGPVLAVLPTLSRSDRSRYLSGNVPPLVIETYNAARANLMLTFGKNGRERSECQVVLVTSTVAGEGKSMAALELARSFARSGRRTILVNADMRHVPTDGRLSERLLPSGLRLSREAQPHNEHASGTGHAEESTATTDGRRPGFADVLAGKAAIEDVITRMDQHNLFAIYSGQPVCNPIDLLSQPLLGDVIRKLRSQASIVIIDTPPAAVVADSLLLAPYSDCVVYVVGIGMTDALTVRNTVRSVSAGAPAKVAYFVNRSEQPSAVQQYSRYYYESHTAQLPYKVGLHNAVSTRTILLDQGASDLHAGAAVDDEANPAAQYLEKQLIAIEGPYAGNRFALSPSRPMSLGIQPDCDIWLAQDRAISRKHARIALEKDGYVIYDDESTNGTFVNSVRIERQALVPGDEIKLGTSVFRFV